MSVNTQRLSAMIDSLNDGNDNDELLYMPRSANNSPPKKQEYTPSPIKQHEYLMRPPVMTGDGATISTHSHSLHSYNSPGNRESMISDYSASIHEGVPVSYVVSSADNSQQTTQIRSTLNFISSQETVGLGISPVEESELSDDSEKAPASNSDNQKFGNTSATDLDPNSSLRLAISGHNTHQKALSSIGSGNLASESGHSRNYSNMSGSGSGSASYVMQDNAQQRYMSDRIRVTKIKEEVRSDEEVDIESSRLHSEEQQPAEICRRSTNASASQKSTNDTVSRTTTNVSPARSQSKVSVQRSDRTAEDNQSIVSSIIPPITTKVPDESSRVKYADRAITTDYTPSIPPRSKNRPKSHIFIKDSLEEIQNQLQQQMMDESASVSRASTTKSSSYYSAADQANEEFGQPDDDSYFHRPLPNIPQEVEKEKTNNVDRSGTLLVKPVSEKSLQTPPRMPNPPKMPESVNTESRSRDRGLSEINVPAERESKTLNSTPKTPTSKTSSPSKAKPEKHFNTKKGKGKKNHLKKEMRSFDIDTISQLLSVTKGTLIGSEFANLGIRTEEKRALERLVDSLSRLTADMVLDPERYEEGLKRLEKATRALEGF
ncbi:LAFE_0E03290g1_1 [Lachancea fermentati]|uniref:LAFE_0E03290g1_1 n=1 Tax=Lachancea fermentati TaxID=4955 RepID=A0A1G4MCV6_LACFM|nr:LAFE_0E03290g1_1 [Lachancea fermentati]